MCTASVNLYPMLKNYLALCGFVVCTLSSFFSMLVGFPIYFFSESVWRAWQDIFKGTFGLIMTTLMWLANPSKMRIYTSSESLKFRVDHHGILQSHFAKRALIISNHQTYSDWVYMWYLAYTANLQGSVLVALKKSLKNIPVLGWSMQWFHFLFLSRKWDEDKEQIEDTAKFLAKDKSWSSWLMLFPEGTVCNESTWKRTEEFAIKTGVPPQLLPKHMLLPRVKGLYSILQGLDDALPVLYDFTIVYEPVSSNPSEAVEQRFSLKRTFLEGRGPQTVKLHIRSFMMHEIPYKESEEAFQQWLYERWSEKDQIYNDLVAGNLESEFKGESLVKQGTYLELYQCFNVPLTLFMLGSLLWRWLA